jgi:hypothetical protein
LIRADREFRVHHHPVDPDGICNIFNLLFPGKFETIGQFVFYLIVSGAGKMNAARIGQALQASGHIDAVAVKE